LIKAIAEFWDKQSPLHSIHLSRQWINFHGYDKDQEPAVAIGRLLGNPLHAISRWPLVHAVPVNLLAAPDKFSGTGSLGFHIDIVNSTNPPDAIVFECVRPDPIGGGQTLSSALGSVIEDLAEEDAAIAKAIWGSEERFFGFVHVGEKLDPYPLFSKSGNGLLYRYTTKILKQTADTSEQFVLSKIQRNLEERAHTTQLQVNEMLIINQRKAVHARLPLGEGQETLLDADRRLLKRLFIRHSAT